MTVPASVLEAIPAAVRNGAPTVWWNPHRAPAGAVLPGLALAGRDVEAARARWRRFAPLLARLFPELAPAGGRMDSPLLEPSGTLADRVLAGRAGRLWVKADHALPVTGCIKARGGVYEVLWYAEQAARAGGQDLPEDYAAFADAAWRSEFARHTVVVGSTGNLGFSVGLMARALGFAAEVHMSSDAKPWKKQRLRDLGVTVVEHAADYTVAVAEARRSAARRERCHFVDDESSPQLFLGYATAAGDLRDQLVARDVVVDEAHPLFVYLPCGVGGAPGGLTFGLKLLFGDAVRCVFVEPVEAPCMLVQLAAGATRAISVYDAGRTNRTQADGLAVAQASQFVAGNVGRLVDAIVTLDDATLCAWVAYAWDQGGLRLEPSAAAALGAIGPFLAAREAASSGPQTGHTGIDPAECTHVAWTTGGNLLPDAVFDPIVQAGRRAGD